MVVLDILEKSPILYISCLLKLFIQATLRGESIHLINKFQFTTLFHSFITPVYFIRDPLFAYKKGFSRCVVSKNLQAQRASPLDSMISL